MARPTEAELQAALHRTVPDIVGPGLDVLFCGINPGRHSALTGRHFAGPGNRFWPALCASGWTPRVLRPDEMGLLPRYGIGITNIVPRATAQASELSREELRAGGEALAARVERLRPRVLAVLGMTAYRQAFGRPSAPAGPQDERVGGAPVWVLPNPSGLNASWPLPRIAAALAEVREAVGRPPAEPDQPGDARAPG
ncbi:G/U mismatch-specific DNA glycosylase [Allonocardiopsis opalescens]|uniref:G/U mismatch-specific DNA glycosylase n=1 Tax=Allonocardiopsis opalescens TaxID=1144618 RepID=UPI000D07A43B|nr:G/U mismatch-specific DNA glycosylase [Allonocardiopsis opalescens]